jgi:hypothetical protein
MSLPAHLTQVQSSEQTHSPALLQAGQSIPHAQVSAVSIFSSMKPPLNLDYLKKIFWQ